MEISPSTEPVHERHEGHHVEAERERSPSGPLMPRRFPPGGASKRETRPRRIYLSPPHLSGEERELVLDAIDSNWIAPLGPHVDAFEREFADAVGSADAAAVSSGTAALHLALRLVGVEPGDVVLVSTLTFAASVFPILYLGARPVFIDSEIDSWNLDPDLLRTVLETLAGVGRTPRAMVVVHLLGQSARMDAITELCERYGVALVEDAAEALGATYRGRTPGTFGRVGIFSFNGNKIITTSSGGMLVSDDRVLVERARKLASQARDPAPHYEHSEVGYNYRMSNLLAAVGRAQLRVLADRVAARRANFEYYREAFSDVPGIDFQPELATGRHSRWLTAVQIDPHTFGAERECLRLALESENIEARPLWKPMHRQPVFADYESFGGDVADRLFERGLCLPSGSSLERCDLERVVSTIRRVSRGARAGPML